MGFSEMKAVIENLSSWDPDKAYIGKDLTLKSKPLRNTCWQRFKAIFAKSKSKEAITALETLKEYAETYKIALAANPDLRKQLSDFNRKVKKTLVKSSEDHHVLKNKKRRSHLNQLCKDINNLNKEIRNIKVHESCKSVYEVSSAKELEDFIDDDLELFISTLDEDSVDLDLKEHEATEIFNALVVLLNANPKFITELDNADNANMLFAQMFRIKHALIIKGDKESQKELRKAYLALSIVLRKPFLEKRVAQARLELQEIKKRVGKDTDLVVKGIVERWERKVEKCKVPAIPKYYHCTKKQYVDAIIQHPVGIKPQHKGKYPGSFASTIPEMGHKGGYGDYCFALSSYIEEKAGNAYPSVTNINGGSSLSTNDPIYLGQPSSAPKVSKRPQIWLGFNQPFTFVKPDKFFDPIGYYQENTLSLMALIGKPGQFPDLEPASFDILAKRKIILLEKAQFDELCAIVHGAIPVVLPKDWGNHVKCPYNCTLVSRKGLGLGFGVTALNGLHGVA